MNGWYSDPSISMQLIWNFKRNLGFFFFGRWNAQTDFTKRHKIELYFYQFETKERTIVLCFLCWSVLGLISLALMEPKCTMPVELYYQYREETWMSCSIFKALQDDFELVRASILYRTTYPFVDDVSFELMAEETWRGIILFTRKWKMSLSLLPVSHNILNTVFNLRILMPITKEVSCDNTQVNYRTLLRMQALSQLTSLDIWRLLDLFWKEDIITAKNNFNSTKKLHNFCHNSLIWWVVSGREKLWSQFHHSQLVRWTSYAKQKLCDLLWS